MAIPTENTNPTLHIKAACLIVILIGSAYILFIGGSVIIPILFSVLIAILLNPSVNYLNRKGIPNVISILMVILITMLILSILVYFLVAQFSQLTEMLPELKVQIQHMVTQSNQWISQHFNIPLKRLQEWQTQSTKDILKDTSGIIGTTILNISITLTVIFLIPIYIFMMLFYKTLFIEFIGRLFTKEKHGSIASIIHDTKTMIQSYLSGLLIESLIVATLNSIGLLIIGVDFAILIGAIGGVLNIIPYIGGIVAVIIPMFIALTTISPAAAGWVLVVYLIVQFVDNNILMHYIVSSKVKINALASIIVVLTGGAIWGIPGMFLSIPLIAIFKIIFDHVDSLKPFGFLLGDTIPMQQNSFFKKLRTAKK